MSVGDPIPTAIATGDGDVARALDWYKDAVIYQLHVRSFYDSDGDGVGDFAGLTQKLDYVASLGVTTIWLLPFYPSPLRDEGYDIADYENVNPLYGTLDDFRKFLDAAHRQGLSVVTELVINHTSDQHPWFQRARRAPKGSPERRYYVWSDSPDRYAGVRVIFKDFEASNWTWDPVAQQYFWHRFYAHQPDLNFDEPAVQDEVFRLVDYWYGMGVDGLRLDAIPYLFEREGTNCESLPETHAFLKRLRRHVDEKFPGRLLLAEANQWPDETAAYFGDDDECQMCFNFPLMPRLFMAVQQEDRFPIVDIMHHTPSPPGRSQWAVFLRNHDELTLEMVTDEERDAMYRYFAADPQSRVNLGLRRRLAPLLRNDRRRLELMHALLFALPGTPVMYYGDEIRMGDNIYLRDRDSVRTPMQWSPDRNGGFSHANPQKLFLPVIADPEFHFLARNVETDEQSPHSLLWWLRRVLRMRRQYRAFGRGDVELLAPQNPRILAFLRRYEDETLLIVVNLSRLSQFAELDLSAFRGRTPIELFGRTRFPMIGELPYLLTLGPHGFYWFRLDWPKGEEQRRASTDLPTVRVAEQWLQAFDRPAADETADAIGRYLARQPWNPAPDRTIRAVEIDDVVPATEHDDDGSAYVVVLVRVHYVEGESGRCQVALIATHRARADDILRDRPTAGVLRIAARRTSASWYLCDAAAEPQFWRRFAEHMARHARTAGRRGEIRSRSVGPFPDLGPEGSASINPIWRAGDIRGTVAAVEKRLFLKLLRGVEPGAHPEMEMALALDGSTAAHVAPTFRGVCEYVRADVGGVALGFAYDYVEHDRPLSDLCREDLRRLLEQAAAGGRPTTAPETSTSPSVAPSSSPPVDVVAAEPAVTPRWFALVGRRVAEAHLALAAHADDPAFAPEPFTAHYWRSLHHGFRGQTQRAFHLLRDFVRRTAQGGVVGPELELLNDVRAFERRFAILLRVRSPLLRIRRHGALLLKKILLHGDDLKIVEWGGDPRRPFGERRLKQYAPADLAQLSLSLRLAAPEATGAWSRQPAARSELEAVARSTADAWIKACEAALTATYRETVAGRRLVPDDPQEFDELFAAFRLGAAVDHLIRVAGRRQDERVPEAVAACLELLSDLPAG